MTVENISLSISTKECCRPRAGVEPVTSWSPVGWRIQLNHRGRQLAIVGILVSSRMTHPTEPPRLAISHCRHTVNQFIKPCLENKIKKCLEVSCKVDQTTSTEREKFIFLNLLTNCDLLLNTSHTRADLF